MIDIDDYLAEDRHLLDRLAHETGAAARTALIEDSIATGEAAIAATTDPVAAANAMIAVAASYLLAANEAISQRAAETHATAAAGWAARAAHLAEGAPGPEVHFTPRAGTIVVAAMAYVPDQTRGRWAALIDAWPQMVADAMVAQPVLASDGESDLIVGLSLLEGSNAAQPVEAQKLQAEAVATLRRAEESLSSAGEVELAAEARRSLDGAQT